MAHAKPVIVQGERGFARLFAEDTVPQFLSGGFYGIGPGGSGARQVVEALEAVADDPARRAALGAEGRSLVERRFSLTSAASRLVDLYEHTCAHGPRPHRRWSDAAAVTRRALALELHLHRPSAKRRRTDREQSRLAAAAVPGRV
jgi:hypothetical protein